jgi:hypothetical protein
MSKFDVIIESAMRRYQGTDLLVGDRVKFIESYLQHEWIKKQASLKLERLKALIESGDNIRVSAVKALRPAVASMGHLEDVDDFYVDIVREQAPGLFTQVFTVPQALLEQQDDYPNLAGDTPKSQVREDDTNIEPGEVKLEDEEGTMSKQTRCEHPAKEMPADNVKLPNTSEPKTGESYTKQYIDQHPYSRSKGDLS